MQEEFALAPILRLQEQAALPCNGDNWWGDSYTDDKARFWGHKLEVTPGYSKVQDPDLWKVGLAAPMTVARARGKAEPAGADAYRAA